MIKTRAVRFKAQHVTHPLALHNLLLQVCRCNYQHADGLQNSNNKLKHQVFFYLMELITKVYWNIYLH